MVVYDFSAQTSSGTVQSLADYEGQVLLIVNTASKCGFTPQYAGLEELQQKYYNQGFSILAFPCNQFAKQEPGSNEEIQNFCRINYQVTFPVFAKIDVNGSNAHPLYQYLKSSKPGVLSTGQIKWNFTKFLIDRTGQVVKRYAPTVKPEVIEPDIVALLQRR